MTLQQESTRLATLGYTSIPVDLKWDRKLGKKVPDYLKGWRQTTLDTCADLFRKHNYNSLAIATGEPSDLIVLDADVKKATEPDSLDGVATINDLFKKHGSGQPCPVVHTPSGGVHYYYSLHKSIEGGLSNTKSRAKVFSVQGRTVCVDVRCDGGNIIAPPSRIVKPEKTLIYSWQQDLVAADDLPPMPQWLVQLINVNNRNSGTSKSTDNIRPARVRRSSTAITLCPDPGSDTEPAAIVVTAGAAFLDHSMKEIQSLAHNTIVSPTRPRAGGYDFKFTDVSKPCFLCNGVHTSNHFKCRQIIADIATVVNYSTTCRMQLVGWRENVSIKDMLRCPTSDDPWVQLLLMKLAFEGRQVVWSRANRRFYTFQGHHWTELEHEEAMKAEFLFSADILRAITRSLQRDNKDARLALAADEDDSAARTRKKTVEAELQAIDRALAHVMNDRSRVNFVQASKTHFADDTFADVIDADPNLLGVRNGVLDLRTGELSDGEPCHHGSKVVTAEWKGLDHPTPLIDDFFSTIFDNDEDLVDYVQRLIGYGITGHVREQVFLILNGSGANGKGVMMTMLKTLLNSYYGPMSIDCWTKGDRSRSKGAPTPYLIGLKGRRLTVCDEFQDDGQLDERILKTITGGADIEARDLLEKTETFPPRFLPILLTNSRPAINVQDDAILRRMNIVPFPVKFKRADQLDLDDPHQRLLDDKLVQTLTEPAALEQLLVWLVKGSISWSVRGLTSPPAAVTKLAREYIGENDLLGQFITECCTVNYDYQVDSKLFYHAFQQLTGSTMTAQQVSGIMKHKGHAKVQQRDSETGERGRYFKRLKITDST